MNRQEAAHFLGVSVSTLDRLASKGQLSRGRARGKTRPRTDFDGGELERLKAHLEQAGRSKPPAEFSPLAPPTSNAVGFRLDPHYTQQLRSEGETQQLSPGEYARKLVIQGLEGGQGEHLREEMATLQRDLTAISEECKTLRGELARLRREVQEGEGRITAAVSAAVVAAAVPTAVPSVPVPVELSAPLDAALTELRLTLGQMFFLILTTQMGASDEDARDVVGILTSKG